MKPTLFPVLARATLASIIMAATMAPASASSIAQPHGSKVDNSQAMREIKVYDSTKAINVARNEIVRITNAMGDKFTWQFDTLHHPTIDLKKIAPAGFTQRPIQIYVGQGADERG